MSPQAALEPKVLRFNPYVFDRRETHLEFTVLYAASDGRTRWMNGTLKWDCYQKADLLQDAVLKVLTDFVRQRWLRIEVCVPNRDAYGWLQPGYIKDTGLLLVTRALN